MFFRHITLLIKILWILWGLNNLILQCVRKLYVQITKESTKSLKTKDATIIKNGNNCNTWVQKLMSSKTLTKQTKYEHSCNCCTCANTSHVVINVIFWDILEGKHTWVKQVYLKKGAFLTYSSSIFRSLQCCTTERACKKNVAFFLQKGPFLETQAEKIGPV